MKNPFRRSQSTTDEVPTEIQQYYTEEARDRRGASWLTGAVVFIVTVAVVLGLFYGGRALYRALTNDDQPATTTEQQQSSDQQNGTSNGQSSDGTQGDQEVTPSPTPTPDPAPTPEPTQPDTTPRTGPAQPEVIPRTGPDADL
jgi:cytoskeletal protein RodZ